MCYSIILFTPAVIDNFPVIIISTFIPQERRTRVVSKEILHRLISKIYVQNDNISFPYNEAISIKVNE